jgi:glycosyltransferase involved in cell wall biosynthesis
MVFISIIKKIRYKKIMSKTQLSIIIITRPQDKYLSLAKESAEFADEVLVIEKTNVEDFAKVRNQALNKAKHEWVLFLDSDEIITQNSIPLIKHFIKQNYFNGLMVKRRDIFYQRLIKYGEAGQSKILRLGKKSHLKWHRRVHEVASVSSRVGETDILLLHLAHDSVSEFIQKITHYAYLEAQLRLQQGQKFQFLEMACYPAGKFVYNFFFKLGFLDGWRGLIYAAVMSLHSLFVRVFLYELTKQNDH